MLVLIFYIRENELLNSSLQIDAHLTKKCLMQSLLNVSREESCNCIRRWPMNACVVCYHLKELLEEIRQTKGQRMKERTSEREDQCCQPLPLAAALSAPKVCVHGKVIVI